MAKQKFTAANLCQERNGGRPSAKFQVQCKATIPGPGSCQVKEESEEKKTACVQVVLRFDDKTPPGPDGPGSRQGQVLRQGELIGGSEEVADPGEDEGPFHHRCPAQPPKIMSVVSSCGTICANKRLSHSHLEG